MVYLQLYLSLFTGTEIALEISLFFYCLFFFVYLALNIFLYSNANYIGTPKNRANLRGQLKHQLKLECKYTGAEGTGEFSGWYKDNELINNEKKDHYLIEITDKVAKLTITLSKYPKEKLYQH